MTHDEFISSTYSRRVYFDEELEFNKGKVAILYGIPLKYYEKDDLIVYPASKETLEKVRQRYKSAEMFPELCGE